MNVYAVRKETIYEKIEKIIGKKLKEITTIGEEIVEIVTSEPLTDQEINEIKTKTGFIVEKKVLEDAHGRQHSHDHRGAGEQQRDSLL